MKESVSAAIDKAIADQVRILINKLQSNYIAADGHVGGETRESALRSFEKGLQLLVEVEHDAKRCLEAIS